MSLLGWMVQKTIRAVAPVIDPKYLSDFLSGADSTTEVTHESALTIDAVFACVRLISATLATLPVDVLQVYQNGAWGRPKPAWMVKPNPESTWRELIQQMVISLLMDGNAFLYPVYNPRNGQLQQLWVLDPRAVSVRRVAGVLQYWIRGYCYDQDELIHVKGMTLPGYLRGLSVIEMARRTLSTNISAEDTASGLFERGLLTNVVVTSDKPVTDAVAEEMAARFARAHAGKANAWKPVVFGNGAIVTPLNLTPEQSQFLQSRGYGVESVARWFGVPLIRIQQTTKVSSWGSGIEQINIMYCQDCINPNVSTLEEVFTLLVQMANPDWQVKWNVRGLLRGDMAAQAQFYKTMVELGAYSPNRVLDLEDENPFTGGDFHYLPLNYGPIDPATGLPMRPPKQGATP